MPEYEVQETLKIARTRDVKMPARGTKHSAGIDFFIPNDWCIPQELDISGNKIVPEMLLLPGDKVVIPMGVYVDLLGSGLENYMLQFHNKSGVAVKKGLVVGANTIDADYQGELMVHIYNPTNNPAKIKAGDKIIQGILIPVKYNLPLEYDITDLYKEKSERGEGRFGSTGTK